MSSMLSWVFDGVRRAAWFSAQTWPMGWFTTVNYYSSDDHKPFKPTWCENEYVRPVEPLFESTVRKARKTVMED